VIGEGRFILRRLLEGDLLRPLQVLRVQGDEGGEVFYGIRAFYGTLSVWCWREGMLKRYRVRIKVVK
jgi:hypothetical protein